MESLFDLLLLSTLLCGLFLLLGLLAGIAEFVCRWFQPQRSPLPLWQAQAHRAPGRPHKLAR